MRLSDLETRAESLSATVDTLRGIMYDALNLIEQGQEHRAAALLERGLEEE